MPVPVDLLKDSALLVSGMSQTDTQNESSTITWRQAFMRVLSILDKKSPVIGRQHAALMSIHSCAAGSCMDAADGTYAGEV